jgi:pilus assembly protein CpaE
VLFVDLSESGDPISDINGLAEVCEPGTVVIATGQINDVRLYRDLLASGIQDYLLKPLNADQVRDSFLMAQSMLATPKQGDSAHDKQRHLMTVIGTRGGSGASMVATSLAWLMANEAGKHTALLDLDVHFGSDALTLDVEPGRGLIDAVDSPGRIDGLFIERSLVRASEKLSLLSAEAPLNQPVITDGSAFFQLEEELRNAFEVTIVDMPRHVLLPSPHLVAETGTFILVSEITLAAARDTIRLLAWFKQNAPRARVLIVGNKVHATGGEMTRKEFEASIERAIDVMIPSDPRLFAQSAKLGKSFAETCRGTKTYAAWLELMRSSLDEGDEAGEDIPARKSATSLLQKLAKIGSKSNS